MELTKKYFLKGPKSIEGISYDLLEKIITGENSNTTVKTINNGLIILSNNVIIKCVRHYYFSPSMGKCKKDTCFGVLSHFGYKKNILINDCVSCHLNMLKELSEKNIKKIYK